MISFYISSSLSLSSGNSDKYRGLKRKQESFDRSRIDFFQRKRCVGYWNQIRKCYDVSIPACIVQWDFGIEAHSCIPFRRSEEGETMSGRSNAASVRARRPNGQSTIECLMRTNHYSRPIGIATWNTGNCPIKSLYASLLVSCKCSLSAF